MHYIKSLKNRWLRCFLPLCREIFRGHVVSLSYAHCREGFSKNFEQLSKIGWSTKWTSQREPKHPGLSTLILRDWKLFGSKHCRLWKWYPAIRCHFGWPGGMWWRWIGIEQSVCLCMSDARSKTLNIVYFNRDLSITLHSTTHFKHCQSQTAMASNDSILWHCSTVVANCKYLVGQSPTLFYQALSSKKKNDQNTVFGPWVFACNHL